MNKEIDRQSLVNSGLVGKFVKARKESRLDFDRSLLDKLEIEHGLDVIDECRKIDNAKCHRVQRCRLKIGSVVYDGNAIFVTLTFRDEIFAKSNIKTRRLRVVRILKKTCSVYVANIDFGEKNGREHYHAIVEARDLSALKKYWEKNCGFLSFKPIDTSKSSMLKITKYINKLNAHCFKDSTKMHRVIYSRNREIGGLEND